MNRDITKAIKLRSGKQVKVSGWCHRVRNLGAVRFVVLRDRTGFIQIVIPSPISMDGVNPETVIEVIGTVKEEPRAKGGYEIVAESLTILGNSVAPLIDIFRPNVVKDTPFETLLESRTITIRIPEILNIFRVQATIAKMFRDYLEGREFTEIFSPKLVLSGAEGGAALFEVGYYGKKAYLAQSPQFYKQIMVNSGLERVFEVGKAYRAENSETNRHLTEFVSLDAEVGFISTVEELIELEYGFLYWLFVELRTKYELKLPDLPAKALTITFAEALEILAKKGKTKGLDGDLDTEGEKMIGEWANEQGSPFVFVTGYNIAKRPFYCKADDTTSLSFDLLYNGVEITTGGIRIHQYQELVDRMKSRGMNPDAYGDYLAIFKHGAAPHGGFGLGLERLTKQILGLSNVKEASLFPRDKGRLTP